MPLNSGIYRYINSMNKIVDRILNHPDKDEFISKNVIGVLPKDIHEWLKAKYSAVGNKKLIISEKDIKLFQNDYLDIYNIIQQDLSKTKSAIVNHTEDDLNSLIQGSSTYQNILVKTAEQELDIRQIIRKLALAIETRLSQVFDEIQQDPRNINTRIDRLLIEYAEVLGNILDKYYKFTESPAQKTDITVQHNVTLQVVDQHISVFHDVIKEVLSQMDLETSLYFMEVFNEKMSKLKQPSPETPISSDLRLAEAKVLNETINKKINL